MDSVGEGKRLFVLSEACQREGSETQQEKGCVCHDGPSPCLRWQSCRELKAESTDAILAKDHRPIVVSSTEVSFLRKGSCTGPEPGSLRAHRGCEDVSAACGCVNTVIKE